MIHTKRLTLTPPTEKDWLILSDLWRDALARQYLGGVFSEEKITEKIISLKQHWLDHQFGHFAVYETSSNQLLGLCGLTHSDDGVELSYKYFPKYWGNGYAFEAAQAMLQYGFNELQLKFIVAITQDKNEKSWKMLEKLGMKLIDSVVRFEEVQRIYKITRHLEEDE